MTERSGRGKSKVLTPPPWFRVAIPTVALLFCSAVADEIDHWIRGELEWDTTLKIAFALGTFFSFAMVAGTAIAWTNRVWVDYDRLELHDSSVLRDFVLPLDAPTQARLSYKPPSTNTVWGTWKVVLTRPGSVRHTVSTPWVRSITDVLEILQPALARNPDLPADDHTRAAFADPSNLSAPPA